MNAKLGLNLPVTARLGFHSLCDWCFQLMRLVSGACDDPEDDTVMEKHGTQALYSAVKRLMHATRTKYEEALQDAAHRMIQIAKPWIIKQWSESKMANGNHSSGYQRRMHTSLNSSGLTNSKHT
jgi:hypothetical protein